MIETIAFLIPVLSLLAYIILSSISFGTSIFTLYPELISHHDKLNIFIDPKWEIIINSVLIFSIITLFVFFPGSFGYINAKVIIPFLVGLMFIGIRIACVMKKFHQHNDSLMINRIFIISSLFAPASLSYIYSFLITSSDVNIYLAPISFLLAIITILSIILISSAYLRFHTKTQKNGLNTLVHEANIIFVMFVIILAPILLKYAPYILMDIVKDILILILLTASFVFLFFADGKKDHKLAFIASISTVSSVYFSLIIMHFPYIAYPSQTIFNSFIDFTALPYLIAGFVLAMVIVIPSLVYLYKRFPLGRKKHTHIY